MRQPQLPLALVLPNQGVVGKGGEAQFPLSKGNYFFPKSFFSQDAAKRLTSVPLKLKRLFLRQLF